MHAEMQNHFAALEGASDLGSARAWCETHVAEMHEMLAGMHDALDRAGCGMMTR
jgi:hypothetical protein